MAKYSVMGDQNAAASGAASGVLKVESPSTVRRANIYDWTVGPKGTTPADQNYNMRLKRQTTAGTWTSATPAPIDPTDAASLMVGGSNSTAAGTASTVLQEVGFNSRAGYRWIAADGDNGGFWVNPSSAHGIILEFSVISGGTEEHIGTALFRE